MKKKETDWTKGAVVFLRVEVNTRDEMKKVRNVLRSIVVQWDFLWVTKIVRKVVGPGVGERINSGFKFK